MTITLLLTLSSCAVYQGYQPKPITEEMDGTATPQEAVIQLLSAGVADKKMTSAFAVEQLTKLLRPDLSVSRRIEARETAKAAFEAGDDIVDKVRSFLVGSQRQRSEQQQAKKRIAVSP